LLRRPNGNLKTFHERIQITGKGDPTLFVLQLLPLLVVCNNYHWVYFERKPCLLGAFLFCVVANVLPTFTSRLPQSNVSTTSTCSLPITNTVAIDEYDV